VGQDGFTDAIAPEGPRWRVGHIYTGLEIRPWRKYLAELDAVLGEAFARGSIRSLARYDVRTEEELRASLRMVAGVDLLLLDLHGGVQDGHAQLYVHSRGMPVALADVGAGRWQIPVIVLSCCEGGTEHFRDAIQQLADGPVLTVGHDGRVGTYDHTTVRVVDSILRVSEPGPSVAARDASSEQLRNRHWSAEILPARGSFPHAK